MIFLSTPFSRAASNRLQKMGIPAFKIGSGECNNYPLLEHVAAFGKPVILSTGMNTIGSVRKAVDIFNKQSIPFALLHTTNLYPTPDHLVRLGGLTELARAFPNAVYGLSDHPITNHACFAAVALGASILERHFTDKKNRPGPDIICSMDSSELHELIEGSKIIFEARGGVKGPVDAELPTIAFAFASIVAIKDIEYGEILTEENIWLKRPGGGDFGATDYDALLGKKSKDFIHAGLQIKKEQVELLNT